MKAKRSHSHFLFARHSRFLFLIYENYLLENLLKKLLTDLGNWGKRPS